MTEKEIAELDAEYSRKYVLYNAISSAVEDYEGSRGGLRAPEVWREVLLLEERLPKAPRPDKFISSERTRLMKDFRRFQVQENKQLYWETKEDRPDKEVERSVMCVLLAFGMRLASYPDGMPNPYERIMERIRQMALQCEDLEMVAAFANDYYDGEEEEEELGNFVPEEDVLKPHVKPRLTKELQAIHDRMSWVFEYFSSTLVMADVVSEDWGIEGFGAIWDDLLMMEPILRAMVKTTGIKNTLQDDALQEGNKDYIVKTDTYNLHLVLNIIGVMMEQGVVKSNASSMRKLFFAEQSKDRYFHQTKFKAFGNSDSAFASEEMYNSIVEIINKHKIDKTE
jgi:hypothetical protein